MAAERGCGDDQGRKPVMTDAKSAVLARMREVGLVPVLRAGSPAEALAIAEAVRDGGVTVLEVTMTVPGALEVIRTLVRDEPTMLVGAGTVLDAETARICMLEGAAFVVSPATNARTIEMCRRYSVPVLPGALTPTEIVTAWEMGADAIKVFPASAMGGAPYLRSLKGPLPQIPLIPTGGVSVRTAKEFLRAGAFALGVGSDLVDTGAVAAGELGRITATARAYLQAIAEFRKEAEPGHITVG